MTEDKGPAGRQAAAPPAAPGKTDKVTVDRVRYIILLLTRAISSMKIYPSYHNSVRMFRSELISRLKKYFESEECLDIAIGEGTFAFRGQVIFQDPDITHSLPYLFFKDGMQRLDFLRGVTEEDLAEFLELIREHALLPTAQGDIVEALWERNFDNIRYFAPENFLEGKIYVGMAAQGSLSDFDKEALFQGSFELTQADRALIDGKKLAQSIKDSQGNLELTDIVAALDSHEVGVMEALLAAERKYSVEKEFLELIFELLYIEDRIEPFGKILDFLEKHHIQLVRNRDFTHAAQFLGIMTDLHDLFRTSSPERARALELFLKNVGRQVTIDMLREALAARWPEDAAPFFDYLKRLGPALLPLGGEIFEHHPQWRPAALEYLREVGQKDIVALSHLAQEKSPGLTNAVISILARSQDKKAVVLLAAFLNFHSPEIKAEAAQALAGFSDELAMKVLLEFCNDPSDLVRTTAAANLRADRDRRALEALIRIAGEKAFAKRSLEEKTAILGSLGRSRADEALVVLRGLLLKRRLFGGRRLEETQLAAVAGLEAMGVPASREVLREGLVRRGPRVQEACRAALERAGAGPAAASEAQAKERP